MGFGLAQTRTPGKAYKSRYENTTHCVCDSCTKTRAFFAGFDTMTNLARKQDKIIVDALNENTDR